MVVSDWARHILGGDDWHVSFINMQVLFLRTPSVINLSKHSSGSSFGRLQIMHQQLCKFMSLYRQLFPFRIEDCYVVLVKPNDRSC